MPAPEAPSLPDGVSPFPVLESMDLVFIVSKEATYAQVVERPEIVIEGRREDAAGGCVWEFAVRWYRLGRDDESDYTPRLEIFQDAWGALTEDKVQSLLRWMARNAGKKPQPDTVKLALLALGFKDVTERPTSTHETPRTWVDLVREIHEHLRERRCGEDAERLLTESADKLERLGSEVEQAAGR